MEDKQGKEIVSPLDTLLQMQDDELIAWANHVLVGSQNALRMDVIEKSCELVRRLDSLRFSIPGMLPVSRVV